MQIDVIPNIGEARTDEFLHKTVIVIDVFRATSTMIAALGNGCTSVVPVETVLQAKDMQKPGDLLGGERFCRKIPGFDLGNSPLEYSPSAVQGKRVILTTTNGTRGIQKAVKGDKVLAGALINGSACAKAAIDFKRDVIILCAGTQDVFSLEDGICAGLITSEIAGFIGSKQVAVNDLGLALWNCYLQAKDTMPETLLGCANGKRLSKLGFQEDLVYCAKVNILPYVPVLDREQMVLLPF